MPVDNQNIPDEMSNMETLITQNRIGGSQRWSPTPVKDFEAAMYVGAFRGMKYELRKNIIYSLQYLQYIQLQINELSLHSVITTQLYKSYIIIAMGIIEGIFYHLIKVNNKQKKEEWEEVLRASTNVMKVDNVDTKYEIITLKRILPARDARMDFESMIAKVRSHHLLKLPQKAYPYIKALKDIRNKVHLFISKTDNDTDYKRFSYDDYFIAQYSLYRVLTDEVFCPHLQNGVFDWLKRKK